MGITTRTIAVMELVLIFPAALFMAALVARHLRPLQYEPSHTAQRIVMWYAARPWTLWGLLIGLPLVVLVTGCVTLLRDRHDGSDPRQAAQPSAAIRAHLAMLIVAAATVAAGGILAVVAAHMLAN